MILDEHSGKIIEGIAVDVAIDIQAQYPTVDYLRTTVQQAVEKAIWGKIEKEKAT